MSSSYFSARLRACLFLVASVLAGCGGGGGGGGNDPPGNVGNKSLTLSTRSLSFVSFQNDSQGDTQDIRVTWTNSKVAGFVVGTLPGQPVPAWLSVESIGSSSPVIVRVRCNSVGSAPGHYAMTLRFVSGDADSNILAQQDAQVACDVLQDPTVGAAVMTWVETEGPADRTLTATHDARVSTSTVTSEVPWVSATLAGDTITLKKTADSATRLPGNYLGTLRTTFTLGTRTRTIISALDGTVTRALTGPASLSFAVDANTEADDLAGGTATITTATAAATSFSVQSDVPWLSVTGGSTGAANNMGFTVLANQLSQLPFGIATGTLTVTPANGAMPLQIPVSIDVQLPEFHFVAPVAYTDQLDTDYVIVRGAGFTSPGFQMRIDGAPVTDADIVSDTELRLVPGQRAVGDHPVTTINALGITRESARLRIADPPPYHSALVPADIGPQTRVVSSPINGVVFSSRAYFTDSYQNPPAGNASVINRFAYDAGTQQWTRTEHAYPQLFDFALSPDESLLIVVTASDLLFVEPGSMQTMDTFPLTRSIGGIARELAVLNNGLVFIDAAHLVFSLRTRSWVDFQFYDTSGGMMGSRDGSRAVIGQNGTPYGYIDASTNAIVAAPGNRAFYCCGAISRHGTVALINEYVVDVDGDVLGSLPTTGFIGDLSPDGTRAYGHDYISGVLRIFDLTTAPPFTELTPISYPAEVASDIGSMAIDPAGHVFFKLTEKYFVVTELP